MNGLEGRRQTCQTLLNASFSYTGNTQAFNPIGNDARRETGFFADSNFLQTFSFPLLKGNPATALKDPGTLLITKNTDTSGSGLHKLTQRIVEI